MRPKKIGNVSEVMDYKKAFTFIWFVIWAQIIQIGKAYEGHMAHLTLPVDLMTTFTIVNKCQSVLQLTGV